MNPITTFHCNRILSLHVLQDEISKIDDVSVDQVMPEELMNRAAELASSPNSAQPFRFFVTTKFVTAVQSLTTTEVVTTHNTCFKTQPGIQACSRKRRSYNVEVRPPRSALDENVFQVEITPTKVCQYSTQLKREIIVN